MVVSHNFPWQALLAALKGSSMSESVTLPNVRYNLEIDPDTAKQFHEWIANRGGVLYWENHDLGSVGNQSGAYTPAKDENGNDYPRPHWRYAGTPLIVDVASIRIRMTTTLLEFRGRLKRYYWGLGLAPQTEAKADRLVASIAPDIRDCYREVTYDWRYADHIYGQGPLAIVSIVGVTYRPFSE